MPRWMTPSGAYKASQASECSEPFDPMREAPQWMTLSVISKASQAPERSKLSFFKENHWCLNMRLSGVAVEVRDDL